jgi:PTS system fructose-specific IIABC component
MDMVNSVKITDYITEDLIDLDLKSKNRESILVELSKLLERSKNILVEDNDIYKALVDREKLGSTGIGKGVAIPHAKTESAKELTVAFGISRKGIDFNSMDDEEVHIFFVFASPNKDSQIYLKVLARISRLIREENFRQNLMDCKTAKEVIACIAEKEN